MIWNNANACLWIQTLHRDYLTCPSTSLRLSPSWLHIEGTHRRPYVHYLCSQAPQSPIQDGASIKARVCKKNQKQRTLFQLYGERRSGPSVNAWDNYSILFFIGHGSVPGLESIANARNFLQQNSVRLGIDVDMTRPTTCIFSLENNGFSAVSCRNLIRLLDIIGNAM